MLLVKQEPANEFIYNIDFEYRSRDEVVGSCFLTVKPEHEKGVIPNASYDLYAVFIKEDYRRQGHGTRMTTEFLDFMRLNFPGAIVELSCSSAESHPDQPEKLYRRAGFTETRKSGGVLYFEAAIPQ